MKRLVFIILLTNIICGCTDLLDKSPQDKLTEETYWKTTTDLELYLNQFYPTLGDNEHLSYDRLDNNSDNELPLSPNDILNGTRSVPGSGGGWDWSNIRKINYFLKNASKVTEGNTNNLNQYMAEGLFFRAYFYFQKVERFGDVPWYNKVLNTDSEGLKASRDPRDAVVDSIIKDLNTAISGLQEKSQLPANRVNKESALLFKSRVALYEGTWEKYHAGNAFGVEGSNGKKYLKIAAKAAGKLVKNKNFGIYSTGNPAKDYWKLFNRTDLSENEEAILIVRKDRTVGLGHNNLGYLRGKKGNATGVTKQLVDAYLDIEGKPISVSDVYKGDSTIEQTVTNRDPRLKQTIWVPGTVVIDYGDSQKVYEYPKLVGDDITTTGYMVRKGSTTDPSQYGGSSSSDNAKTDGFIFRYAEALLNYAEAKAELGTLTQDDLDKSINLLRGRVGLPKLTINISYTDPNWNFPNLTPIINEIRRERRIELALEGYRYDDLMRWAAGALIKGLKLKGARFIKGKSFPDIEDQLGNLNVDKNQYIWPYKNFIPTGFGFDETRDYLYPIPTEQLTLNQNLEQNPGW